MVNEVRDHLLSLKDLSKVGRDELIEVIGGLQKFLRGEMLIKEGWVSVRIDELKELLVRGGALQDQVDELQTRMTAMALERQKVDQMLTAVMSASTEEVVKRDNEIAELKSMIVAAEYPIPNCSNPNEHGIACACHPIVVRRR